MCFGRIVPGDTFDGFLESIAQDSSTGNRQFIARNFLLDEGVCSERQDSYDAAGAMQGHAVFANWHETHQNYLDSQVFLKKLQQAPTQIDRTDEESCPETFRYQSAFRDFGAADADLELVRVVEVRRRDARNAGLDSEAELIDLSRGYLTATSSIQKEQALNAALEKWDINRDLRPVWATFWEEVYDLFGSGSNSDTADWADELRDRLGLYHLDPIKRMGEIPVLVFRYPTGVLPRLRGQRDLRPIAVPTVLDGRFGEAFCPAPSGEPHGYVVYLGQQPYQLRPEILHPSIQFKASHLFRVGTIRRGVPADLTGARGEHIKQLRGGPNRANYAIITDR